MFKAENFIYALDIFFLVSLFQVYIFTHVPVGNFAIRSPYDDSLMDIIIEYASIIKSIHAAHEHLDRFRLISDKDDSK